MFESEQTEMLSKHLQKFHHVYTLVVPYDSNNLSPELVNWDV